jgi:methylmalonyl-CoA/ethylmalonyl-CoA epimerase
MSNFRINHVAMAVPDIASFLDQSRALYGEFARGPVITNDRQAVREQFITDGKTTIELLEPIGDKSPIRGFLARQPFGGLVHVAFDVDALEPAIAELAAAGGKLVTKPVPDVAFDDRRIAFVLVGGQLIELIERGGAMP